MKLYSPMARVEYKPNQILGNRPLFLSTPVMTIAEAVYQFFIWSNCYGERIIHAWIEVHEDGKEVDKIEYYKDSRACDLADEALAKEEAEQAQRRGEARSSPRFQSIDTSLEGYYMLDKRGVANQNYTI